MIYFAQAESGGPIKIGTTYDLDQRILSLKKAFDGVFRILAVMDGGYAEEKALHGRFADLRVFGNGRESFSPAPSLLDFIEAEGKSWEPKPPRPEVEKAPKARFVLPRKAGRPKTGVSPILLSMRGKDEWKAWLIRFAQSRRVTPSTLVDQVLAEAAQRDDFEPPPPRL